jgi:hypothetical protein
MMKDILRLSKAAFAMLCISFLASRCSEEQVTVTSPGISTPDLNTSTSSVEYSDCSSCTYVVPAGVSIVDGKALGLQPGSVIGLDARIPYKNLKFQNINGTADQPIIIKNCGGTVRIDGTGKTYGILTVYSSYYRITGGDVNNTYGIVVTGGTMGLNLGMLSNHFEVDHVVVQNSGFAGIMAKTDPSCDPATWRENFLMKAITLRNNYIHDTGGEGIYAGNSFFMGMTTDCGEKLPHEIHYIRIFANRLKNTGWEAIQLGCATKGASVHANIIENYGTANVNVQNNGIQIGTGTGGVCYNNLIKGGKGNGIIVLGLGDNMVYNNVIDHAGNYGIFCDERYSPGPGFKFFNNTILSPASDGIRIYADLVPMNVIINNIISNPGSYDSDSRSPNDAFVHRLNANVKIDMSHNYFTTDSTDLQSAGYANAEYKLVLPSPVVDQGADISIYNINRDFYYKPRLRGAAYDIGAVEQN